MRPLALLTIAAIATLVPTAASADRYFARVKIGGVAASTSSQGSTPPGIAQCGALVKGQWFVDWQQDTGRTAATLSEAQAVCDSLATTGAGTCGWTGDAYYGDHTRFRVFWTKMVATRQYNEPGATEGFVWAVGCPLR